MKNIPLILTLAVFLFACNTKSGTEADVKEDNSSEYVDSYVDTEATAQEGSDQEAQLDGGYAESSFDENEDYDFEHGDGEESTTTTFLDVSNVTYDVAVTSESQNGVLNRGTKSESAEGKKVLAKDKTYSEKIIRTAEIGLELKDYSKGKRKILAAAKKHHALVAEENEKSNYSKISNRIVFKIPSEHFDDFMAELDGGFSQFDYKRVNTQDVGEEFYDLKARLKTKKEMEIRYMGFLKKAKSIKDLLRIEEQIRKIREEIEAKEGRLRYLSSRVSFSTIHLNIYQNLDFDQPVKQQAGFGSKFIAGLKSGWNSILKLIIGLSYGWPYLLFFGFAGYFAIRWLRTKKL